MSARRDEDETDGERMDPGERMDNTEREVLFLLYRDPFPWTVEELGRELGDLGNASDAVTSLAAAGLLHRFPAVARRDGAGPEFVIPTRAARRSDELHEHSL
jgi:hypothetical protein